MPPAHLFMYQRTRLAPTSIWTGAASLAPPTIRSAPLPTPYAPQRLLSVATADYADGEGSPARPALAARRRRSLDLLKQSDGILNLGTPKTRSRAISRRVAILCPAPVVRGQAVISPSALIRTMQSTVSPSALTPRDRPSHLFAVGDNDGVKQHDGVKQPDAVDATEVEDERDGRLLRLEDLVWRGKDT